MAAEQVGWKNLIHQPPPFRFFSIQVVAGKAELFGS